MVLLFIYFGERLAFHYKVVDYYVRSSVNEAYGKS